MLILMYMWQINNNRAFDILDYNLELLWDTGTTVVEFVFYTICTLESFFDKILKYAKVIGVNLIYKALQLYYVLQKPDVPAADKGIIIAALGYLISPLDFIPDPIPVAGYTDDALALALAIAKVSMYIDEEVNRLAKQKLDDIFGQGTSDNL